MTTRRGGWLGLTLAVLLCAAATHAQDTVLLESFEARGVPDGVELDGVRAKTVKTRDAKGRALRVRFEPGSGPGIALSPDGEAWDWTAYSGLAVTVTNPGSEPVNLFMRADSKGDDGGRRSARSSVTLPAGETTRATIFFLNYGAGPYWGMRGIPVMGPVMMHGPGLGGPEVNRGWVTGVQFYLRQLDTKCELVFDNAVLFKPGSEMEKLCPHPFIDKYGQYMHGDWPDKIDSDAQFKKVHEAEDAALAWAPAVPGWDEYGGWADGPELEATGWFRVEQIDGKWWLVTPSGHLFFSIGSNCLYAGGSTFITGREDWFSWVPAADGPFKRFRGHVSGVHSMGESINGDGDTVNFYQVNLKRRYGDDWAKRYQEAAYKRLPAWGFNTIGNWSWKQILDESPLPFTVTGGTGGRSVEGSSGFWGKMIDVFDPSFTEAAEKGMTRLGKDFGSNPLVVGYFVDNEMSWKAIALGVMQSPPDQAARQVFVADLKAKYGSLDKLTAAWGVKAASWDALRVPPRPNEAAAADCDAYEYKFARHYFETVRNTLKRHAPNQLYLGCRFTLRYCPAQVLKACAEVVDVVSVNIYQEDVHSPVLVDMGKPYIVGEFHFGALDRGMFHQGLQSAVDQDDRARMFVDYVKSAIESPLYVGCHWFQFADQPLTGRAMDGENYSVGLVTIVDVPHKELTEASRALAEEMYTLGTKK
ncbi:MAG: family 14 glycosylhydrolase [bacterium]|nr:family 14 glycosylhydrolase [bacterium]